MTYFLEWFELDGDELVGEEPVEGLSLESLQRLFGVPTDNPMYDGFEVSEEHVETLQAAVQHTIDLTRHTYFVAGSRTQ